MKVYFGEALQDMVSELRGQAVKNVRLHTIFEADGDVLKLSTHVTTFCNSQIYEAVIATKTSLSGVGDGQREEFIAKACEEAREKIVKRLTGFEIRRGVLQE